MLAQLLKYAVLKRRIQDITDVEDSPRVSLCVSEVIVAEPEVRLKPHFIACRHAYLFYLGHPSL